MSSPAGLAAGFLAHGAWFVACEKLPTGAPAPAATPPARETRPARDAANRRGSWKWRGAPARPRPAGSPGVRPDSRGGRLRRNPRHPDVPHGPARRVRIPGRPVPRGAPARRRQGARAVLLGQLAAGLPRTPRDHGQAPRDGVRGAPRHGPAGLDAAGAASGRRLHLPRRRRSAAGIHRRRRGHHAGDEHAPPCDRGGAHAARHPVLLGAHAEDVAFRDELRMLNRRHMHFRAVIAISDGPGPSGSTPAGSTKRCSPRWPPTSAMRLHDVRPAADARGDDSAAAGDWRARGQIDFEVFQAAIAASAGAPAALAACPRGSPQPARTRCRSSGVA